MSTTRKWGALIFGAGVGMMAWSPSLFAQDSASAPKAAPVPKTAPTTEPEAPAQAPFAEPETEPEPEPPSQAPEAQKAAATDPAVTPAGSSLPRSSGEASSSLPPEATPAVNQDAGADQGASADPSQLADPSPPIDSSSSAGRGGPQGEGAADDDAEPAVASPPPKEPKKKKYQLAILLDTTLGLGNTAQFVSKPSFQGFSLDARYYVTDNIGIGLGAAFDTVSERGKDTFQWDNVTIAGTHTKQVSFTPLLAKGVYAFRNHPKYAPYIAIGVGAARHASQVHAGFSNMRRAAWHFATAPEVGVTFSVSKARLLASLRTTYLPATKDVSSQMFANLSLGIAIQ